MLNDLEHLTLAPSNEEESLLEKPYKRMNPLRFLKIVNAIDQAITLEGLFNAAMELSPIQSASYHHFPSVGAYDYGSLGRYFTYNLPAPIEEYYKNYNIDNVDPGLVAVFEKGQFVWLTDLVNDPIVVEAGHQKNLQAVIDMTDDALCIPLFGPHNRRGYMFISGNLTKAETEEQIVPSFPYEVQALAQHLHVRFCLILQKLQRQVKLTPRETEVLELLAFGKTNQDIAHILDISVTTVAGYLKAVFLKLEVSDRVSASMRAQTMKVAF